MAIGGVPNIAANPPSAMQCYHLDARIYSHPLSQTEIDALVAAGPEGDVVGANNLSRPPLPAVLSCLPASLSRGFR